MFYLFKFKKGKKEKLIILKKNKRKIKRKKTKFE